MFCNAKLNRSSWLEFNYGGAGTNYLIFTALPVFADSLAALKIFTTMTLFSEEYNPFLGTLIFPPDYVNHVRKGLSIHLYVFFGYL